VILAIVHTTPGSYLLAGMALVVLAVWSAIAMGRRRVESYWPYLLVSGGMSWSGLFLCGLHPALALVPIVPFMPHAHRPSGLFEDPGPRARDTLSRFERWWAPAVQAVLFLFGLVNAGVPLHGLEAGMWALPVATMVGRPFGVLLGAGAGVSAGLHRTAHVGWKELLVIGCAASIGLTFALFLATAILPLGPLLLQMKTGALLTAGGAVLTFLTAWLLGVGRFRAAETEEAH
jgi:NhaA family Na+:H+ antiporter